MTDPSNPIAITESAHPKPAGRLQIIGGALLILIGIAFCASALSDYQSHRVLKTSGEFSPGIVTSSSTSRSTEGGTSYQANYQFTLSSGELVTNIALVDKTFYLKACKEKNMPVSVLYDPNNPENNYLPGYGYDLGSLLVTLLFAGLLISFGWLLYRGRALSDHFI